MAEPDAVGVELQGRMIAELEEASLRAWPALEEVVLDRWRLRFSGGPTKRLNSVQPVSGSTIPLDEKLKRCEAWYASKGQACIFRLTPISETAVDDVLSNRGYTLAAPSIVLYKVMEDSLHESDKTMLQALELDAWLEVFGRLAADAGAAPRFRNGVLSRIAGRRLLAVLRAEDGSPVACGVGVLEGGFFGLFDVLVSAERRREGFGRLLVTSMLFWARQRGGHHAYLQVGAANQGARRLYERLGFLPAYPYWYRVQAP